MAGSVGYLIRCPLHPQHSLPFEIRPTHLFCMVLTWEGIPEMPDTSRPDVLGADALGNSFQPKRWKLEGRCTPSLSAEVGRQVTLPCSSQYPFPEFLLRLRPSSPNINLLDIVDFPGFLPFAPSCPHFSVGAS